MGTVSVSDAKRLMLGILRSLHEEATRLEEKRFPPGTERPFKMSDGSERIAFNDDEGNWWWKDDPSVMARRARARAVAKAIEPEDVPYEDEEDYKPYKGKKGEAYPQLASKVVKDPRECNPKDVFVPYDKKKGGRCVKGVEVARGIDEMIAGALDHDHARPWYRESKEAMDAVFGPDSPCFLALMAATSQRMDLGRNIALSMDIYRSWVEGSYPEGLGKDASAVLGFTEGSAGFAPIRKNVEKALRGDFKLGGIKIGTFGKALFGDEKAVTIDVHMFNLFFGRPPKIAQYNKKKKKMEMKEVGYPEEYTRFAQKKIKQAAKKLDWDPAELQAAMWVFWLKDLGPKVDPKAVQMAKEFQKYSQVFEKRAEQMGNLTEWAEKLRTDPAAEWEAVMSAQSGEGFGKHIVKGKPATDPKELKKKKVVDPKTGRFKGEKPLPKWQPVPPKKRKKKKKKKGAAKKIAQGAQAAPEPKETKKKRKLVVDTETGTFKESVSLWHTFSLLHEQERKEAVAKPKPKRKDYNKVQHEILDSLIAILQAKQKAYVNAGKLVREIERMHKNGEMDKLIANAAAQGK